LLFLRTFGGLAIENGGRPIVGAASQRGRLAILAVLAASGGRAVSKDRLHSLFWPESDAGHARAALNQALYALRRDVGERALTIGTTELGLNPEVIRSDVADFERALVSGDIERAAELYTGPFLDSIHLAGLEEFEGWVERERGRFLAVYQAALDSVARDAQSRNDVLARARWRKVLSALDPMSARNALGGMEALVAAGDRESAIQLGRAYTQLVRARLGVENADPAIAELIEAAVTGKPAALPSLPEQYADFSRRIMPGSKFRSRRVLALDTDSRVFENTIFSAACQMLANSRTKDGWLGTVRAVSQ
jgi:DNA-binding SARP family transcriptional activator